MSTHQPHPKCATCGRALFKAPDVGVKVKPTDEYQYCRNPDCDQYCYRETGAAPEAPPEPTTPPVPAPPPARAGSAPARPKRRARAADEVAEPPPPEETPVAKEASEAPEAEAGEGEPISVHVARARIKALLSQWTDGRSAVAIGLVLAIVNQELGCHEGANALIREFKLDELFGLEVFTDGSPDDDESSDAST